MGMKPHFLRCHQRADCLHSLYALTGQERKHQNHKDDSKDNPRCPPVIEAADKAEPEYDSVCALKTLIRHLSEDQGHCENVPPNVPTRPASRTGVPLRPPLVYPYLPSLEDTHGFTHTLTPKTNF
jgi:hypothetical protein